MVILITAYPAIAQEQTIRQYTVMLTWDKKHFGNYSSRGPGELTLTARAEGTTASHRSGNRPTPGTAPSAAWEAPAARAGQKGRVVRPLPLIWHGSHRFPTLRRGRSCHAGWQQTQPPVGRRGQNGNTPAMLRWTWHRTYPAATLIFHSEKHNRRGKKINQRCSC